jgi:hypothetical protein
MRRNIWRAGAIGLVVLLVGLAFLLPGTRQTALAAAADDGKAGCPHYTVVMTEAHNLLVTDNAADKLYFYTIDKDKPVGSPLKLRATLDLTKVGQDEITITTHNLEKIEK